MSKKNKNKSETAPITEAAAATTQVDSTAFEGVTDSQSETTSEAAGEQPETKADQSTSQSDAKEEPAKEKKTRQKKEPAPKSNAHLAKVEKFGNTLPTPSAAVAAILESCSNLSAGDLSTLAAHAQFAARRAATVSSSAEGVAMSFKKGDHVRIIACAANPRMIGLEGVVTRVNRIRIFVDVGRANDAYLFIREVESLEKKQVDLSDSADEPAAATG